MSISELRVHDLRNIASARFQLHPRCNLIYGPNGSGKTSLLEAIYLLGSGHSFRTREISPLLAHGENALTVFARTTAEQTISIQKSLSGVTQVKLNNQTCYSSSELARLLPCQIFYQDIFQIIDAGPSVRRSLLDWGLFHVEQSYHTIWKEYRLVLKQRNALLRKKAHPKEFVPWNHQMVTLGESLDSMRQTYVDRWIPAFNERLFELTDFSCAFRYYKGWDRKESGLSLATQLEEQFPQDIQRQYTHAGAHQADLLFEISSKKAKLLLSRGQQKIVLIALKLAQADLVAKDCLYLFDDIIAELDMVHQVRLFDCLKQIKGQVFLTMTNNEWVNKLRETYDFNTYATEKGSFQRIDPL